LSSWKLKIKDEALIHPYAKEYFVEFDLSIDKDLILIRDLGFGETMVYA
jgi:hypothetical protein